MAASSSAAAAAKPGDDKEKKAPVHEVLEEDDEFEVRAREIGRRMREGRERAERERDEEKPGERRGGEREGGRERRWAPVRRKNIISACDFRRAADPFGVASARKSCSVKLSRCSPPLPASCLTNQPTQQRNHSTWTFLNAWIPQEFQERDWDETAEDAEDSVLFEEDWDDTEINDDFTNQLRKELAKK